MTKGEDTGNASGAGSGEPLGERLGDAFGRTWTVLADRIAGAWSRRTGATVAVFTGASTAAMNGVCTWSPDTDPQEPRALLAEVAATGVPYGLTVPAEAAARYDPVVAEFGLGPGRDVPLMARPPRAGPVDVATPRELTIRRLGPDERDRHVRLAAAVFDMPEAPLAELTTSPPGGPDPIDVLVGEVDGVPVTTGLGITLEDFTGVFNVATAPAYRRRGYGAALTARLVRDGADRGATWAWLQATPAGLPVYRRLGFEVCLTWRSWGSG